MMAGDVGANETVPLVVELAVLIDVVAPLIVRFPVPVRSEIETGPPLAVSTVEPVREMLFPVAPTVTLDPESEAFERLVSPARLIAPEAERVPETLLGPVTLIVEAFMFGRTIDAAPAVEIETLARGVPPPIAPEMPIVPVLVEIERLDAPSIVEPKFTFPPPVAETDKAFVWLTACEPKFAFPVVMIDPEMELVPVEIPVRSKLASGVDPPMVDEIETGFPEIAKENGPSTDPETKVGVGVSVETAADSVTLFKSKVLEARLIVSAVTFPPRPTVPPAAVVTVAKGFVDPIAPFIRIVPPAKGFIESVSTFPLIASSDPLKESLPLEEKVLFPLERISPPVNPLVPVV